MHVNIITLFPDLFPGFLGHSLTGKALDKGLWSYTCYNPRDYAEDVHKSVDDTPYGGGAGMVMRADILEKCFLDIPDAGQCYYLSPRGRVFNQQKAESLSNTEENITLLCGRYEGVDQRFLDAYNFEEISIGDYVLTGGEQAAQIMMDACIRLLPGVLGNSDTPDEESFTSQSTYPRGLLEYPHYTKPAEWTDAQGTTRTVPDVLTSGHHKNIDQWRNEQSLKLTKARRPDLLDE